MATDILQGKNPGEIVGWQPALNSRGTADIIITCLITISLCIWSALHLNVPGEKGSQFLAKLRWMALALVAPEIVAFTAWYQRCQAKRIQNHMNRRFGKAPSPRTFAKTFGDWSRKLTAKAFRTHIPSQSERHDIQQEAPGDEELGVVQESPNARKHQWTLKHGFFATMGGYGLHVPRLPTGIRFLPKPDDEEYYIITVKGLEFLSEIPEAMDAIPDLSEADIDSRAKASWIAKSIVCIQALWFCAGCITRVVQGLPISLLELNTFGHAVCILLTYVFWWKKPFDVEKPHYFQSRFLHPQAARLCMSSHTSSFGQQWAEQAEVHVSRNFQCQKFFGEYDNVEVKFVGGLSDIKALHFEPPHQPDKDAFLNFCKLTDVIPTSSEQCEKHCSIKWNQPIQNTGFSMATKVPSGVFKVSLRSTDTDAPNQNLARLLLERFKHVYREIILLRDFSPSIVDRLICGMIYLIMLPTGLWVLEVLVHTFWESAGTFRSSRSLFRISLDEEPPRPVQISKRELILMQTAWQDIQVGRPVLEDEPDLISKSKLGELTMHRSLELGFWAAVVSIGSLMLCPAAYGGLHLVGWNGTFSSDVEQQLWRLSSVVVMVGLEAIMLPIMLADALNPLLDRFIENNMGVAATDPIPHVNISSSFGEPSLVHLLLIGRIIAFVLWTLAVNVASISLLAYLLARGYLVVDSLVNLWHLPAGVYETPNWSLYFPHIS